MRLFVAVHFTPEVKSALLRAIGDVRAQCEWCNPTREENLHLTLAFIGEARDPRPAIAALDECVCPAFSITVGGAGRFGDLWWAGIEPSRELSALAERIQSALRARGFDIERRPFKPHITLAREVRSDAPLRLDVPRMNMPVGRVSLMKSERINGRLTYTEVYGRALTCRGNVNNF